MTMRPTTATPHVDVKLVDAKAKSGEQLNDNTPASPPLLLQSTASEAAVAEAKVAQFRNDDKSRVLWDMSDYVEYGSLNSHGGDPIYTAVEARRVLTPFRSYVRVNGVVTGLFLGFASDEDDPVDEPHARATAPSTAVGAAAGSGAGAVAGSGGSGAASKPVESTNQDEALPPECWVRVLTTSNEELECPVAGCQVLFPGITYQCVSRFESPTILVTAAPDILRIDLDAPGRGANGFRERLNRNLYAAYQDMLENHTSKIKLVVMHVEDEVTVIGFEVTGHVTYKFGAHIDQFTGDMNDMND